MKSVALRSTARVIQVVLFDLDDTLFAHAHAVSAGVSAHRLAHGGAVAAADDAEELARWHELEELHYVRYLHGELDFYEQRRVRARNFVEPFGLDLADDSAADEWYERYLVEYQKAWRLHEDTIPCLDELASRGIRVGIITNGELAYQVGKVEAMGIAPRVEHVIASGELGFAKPDPRIFAHACARFGVDASSAAYVGDRLHTDAIGAASAGLLGVWIDRHGTATADDLAEAAESHVPVISTLAALPPLLG